MALIQFPGVTISAGGLATEAKQDLMITDLGTIAADTTSLDAKLPAQGAAATAASTPVNIASDQVVPISATALPLAPDAATETSLAVVAGDTTSLDAKVPAQGAAVTASSTPVNIASDQVVPVSASTLPLPSGAATEASLATVAGDTTSLDAKVPSLGSAIVFNSMPVNIASDQVVPVSATALPLPTGAATEATLATVASDTTSLDTKLPAQGAAATAASTPVNIASDQVVPVSASALPLPSGAATEATLATIDADTSSMNTDIGLLEDRLAGSLVPETFDYEALTYVAAGNGEGEVETVVYKTGGAAGSTVATLTLAYNSDNKVSSVTRT